MGVGYDASPMMASTDWKERVAPDEDKHLERLAEELRALARARKSTTPDRYLHAKGNAGLEAELTIAPSLPEELRVGIFAAPGRYRGYVRYSNGAGARQDDRRGDVRGVALKLVGVPGKKLIPGMEEARTQDLLFIRTPTVPLRTAAEFVALVRAARSPALALPRFLGAFGLRRTFALLPTLARGLNAPMMPLAATRYFSALPIQWGRHAAKLSLDPHERHEGAPPKRASGTALGDELVARLKRGPVSYDLRVQLFVDEERTPIEDPTVEWTEAVAPFHTVATLTLPKQDPASPRGQRIAALVEKMSFDPWHAPVEFRPLGEMMRARNHAYRLSTLDRKAAPEPDGSELDDVASAASTPA